MTEQEIFNKHYSKAAAICSRAEKCEDDIKKKLSEWEVLPHVSKQIIQKLTEDKFIDNQRFATSFVKEKFSINKWGKIKIGINLRQKKIDNSIINDSLDQINQEDYVKCLQELLIKKQKTIKNEIPYNQKMKLLRFACSRGFESEIVSVTIDKNKIIS